MFSSINDAYNFFKGSFSGFTGNYVRCHADFLFNNTENSGASSVRLLQICALSTDIGLPLCKHVFSPYCSSLTVCIGVVKIGNVLKIFVD